MIEKATSSMRWKIARGIRGWGGTWYPWALNKTGFKRYIVVAFGHRSAIERFFGDIGCRIRRFWNGFIGNYNRKSMQLWIEAFAGFRNCMKDSNGVLS